MPDQEIGVAQLRTNIRLNNRLRLEFHASLSRLLREYGLNVSDSGLSELTLATPRELMGLAGTDVDTKHTTMSATASNGNGANSGEDRDAPEKKERPEALTEDDDEVAGPPEKKGSPEALKDDEVTGPPEKKGSPEALKDDEVTGPPEKKGSPEALREDGENAGPEDLDKPESRRP